LRAPKSLTASFEESTGETERTIWAQIAANGEAYYNVTNDFIGTFTDAKTGGPTIKMGFGLAYIIGNYERAQNLGIVTDPPTAD